MNVASENTFNSEILTAHNLYLVSLFFFVLPAVIFLQMSQLQYLILINTFVACVLNINIYQSQGQQSAQQRCILQCLPRFHHFAISHTRRQTKLNMLKCVSSWCSAVCYEAYLGEYSIVQFARLITAGGQRKTCVLPRL